MQRLIIGLVVLVLISSALPLIAQDNGDNPPDYAITNLTYSFSDDESEITIEVEVTNTGGVAEVDATVNLISSTGRIIATETLPPLESGAIVRVPFTFATGNEFFSAGSSQSIIVEVGIDQVEPLFGPTIDDNSGGITVTIPETINSTGGGTDGQIEVTPVDSVFVVPLLGIEVDTSNPIQVALLIVGVGVTLLLLWLVIVILRLLFSRPPTFGTWQPPYANMPQLDPNSIGGRRQMWQHHAQNGSLLIPCTDQPNLHALKLLHSMDGAHLLGWNIIAMRMSQYDMYGRVNRTQVLGSKGMVKRMNKQVKRSRQVTVDKVRKGLQPVARHLTKQIKKKINKRTLGLPIALDMRFLGAHGEVRIVFELYECQNWNWQRIDTWEPEMTVMSREIYETYTYTLNGQIPGETQKQFYKRLETDVLWLLTEMVKPHPTDMVPPDTLSNMKPITDEVEPAP